MNMTHLSISIKRKLQIKQFLLIALALLIFPFMGALLIDHMIFGDASAVMHIIWMIMDWMAQTAPAKTAIII